MSLGSYTEYNRKRVINDLNKVNSLASKYSMITHSKDKKTHTFTYYDSINNRYYNENVLLTDEEYEFRVRTEEFKKLLRNGSKIEDIMVDAIALCREATKRRLSMFQYDTQVEACIAMQDNAIVEMKTGEGKTLVQILSAYLSALEACKDLDKSKWKSTHILTANDYLAKRDKEDNSGVFSLLGMSTGYAIPQNDINKDSSLKEVKRKEYLCDIVYGTAKTVAFDYLKDNHIYKIEDKFLRKPLYKAIVDEADDILLDQATRPLILSQSKSNNDMQGLYNWAIRFINGEKGYRDRPVRCRVFNQYDKNKSDNWQYLDDYGRVINCDSALYIDREFIDLSDDLYDEIYKNGPYLRSIRLRYSENEIERAISQCLLAREYYKSGKQYQLVKDQSESSKQNRDVYKIVLTDVSTGRSMESTRYEGGLQEAIEANEGYLIEKRNINNHTNYGFKFSKKNELVAKVTYPDFLKLYEGGISGMTGTSDIDEFKSIYGLQTYVVSPRIPSKRVDEASSLYVSEDAKFRAIVEEIKKCKITMQPVLVGTTNVSESDRLCRLLRQEGILFQRLDAVNESNENNVKLYAGQKGAVTIATNMAGRGIDIKLGEGVKELGGLYVIGSSKNKNVRIDNQLRGRAARQGDPGKTKYFMSLDDELVRMRYGSNAFDGFKKLYSGRKEEIHNKILSSIVDKCQLSEEGHQKDIRRSNEQRDARVFTKFKNIIYKERNVILNSSNLKLSSMISSITDDYVNSLFKSSNDEEILSKIGHCIVNENCMTSGSLDKNKVLKVMHSRLNTIDKRYSNYYELARYDILRIVDDYWVSFMHRLDELWMNCSYYSYSSKDPIDQFESEANSEFIKLNDSIKNEIITYSIYPNLEYGRYKIKDNDENTSLKEGKGLK